MNSTFFSKNRSAQLPFWLLGAYLLQFIFLGINPYSRSVWVAENIPVVLIVSFLVYLFCTGFRFSNTAYLFMSVLVFMHTIGGHYTFERVPFDWFNNLFGYQRNMYDRIAHFSVGFYAYPFLELLERKQMVNQRWLGYFTAFCFIVMVAAGYEIIEWIYAISNDSAAGTAFLGSQGDIWDAQKDMLMDSIGAIFSLFVYFLFHKNRS